MSTPGVPTHLIEHAARRRQHEHFAAIEAAMIALLDHGARLEDLEIVTVALTEPGELMNTTVRLRE